MQTAGGRILRLLAAYVWVQCVHLKRAIMCENVHMYSEDSGRRRSANSCSGSENESAFNTWRELNVLSVAHWEKWGDSLLHLTLLFLHFRTFF